jgi:hypothetical protein
MSAPKMIALLRDVDALTLDPLTRAVIHEGVLPAGTVIEDPHAALVDAEIRQLDSVVVRTVYEGGWLGLERIATATLRRAVG